MSLPQIHVYIATSLDGFIADKAGSVAFLDAFMDQDYGYQRFFSGIGAIVMGRKSYQQIQGFGHWPYGTIPTYVLSADELPEGTPAHILRDEGEALPQLVHRLKRDLHGKGDIWLLGGGELIRSFLDANLIDKLELFTMPTLLGQGIPLFTGAAAKKLQLQSTETFTDGVIRSVYTPVKKVG